MKHPISMTILYYCAFFVPTGFVPKPALGFFPFLKTKSNFLNETLNRNDVWTMLDVIQLVSALCPSEEENIRYLKCFCSKQLCNLIILIAEFAK